MSTSKVPSKYHPKWLCWASLAVIMTTLAAGVFAVVNPDCTVGHLSTEMVKGAIGGALVGVGLALFHYIVAVRTKPSEVATAKVAHVAQPSLGGKIWIGLTVFVDLDRPIGHVGIEMVKGAIGGALVGLGLVLLFV
jgi:hypothetical protein